MLEDHPYLDGERAMVALGADTPPCLAMLDTWIGALRDGGFLHEWAGTEMEDVTRQRRFRTSWARAVRGEAQDMLVQLPLDRAVAMGLVIARFPHPLQDRLALGLGQAMARHWGSGRWQELEPVLARAIAVRARTAFVRSLRVLGAHPRPDALVPFRCELVEPGAEPWITGRLAAQGIRARIGVRPTWLAEVWGRGLSVVDDHLVLDVVGPSTVLAVRWEPDAGGLRPAVVRATLSRVRPDSPPVLRWPEVAPEGGQ